MNSSVLAEQLASWLGTAAGRRFDVDIAGRPLGGKRGETPLTPREFAIADRGFTLQFGGGRMVTIHNVPGVGTATVQVGGTEVLEVTTPAGVSVLGSGDLLVQNAAAVRFGWHYYGRPQTPENWCVDTYTLQGAVIRREHSGPLPPRLEGACTEILPYPAGPFIHLIPLDP
jgi:hypothetical protein